ncbi:MAG TPA: ABC transporter substrate-binding protein [Vitreimonas sp.]|nr:ABC transporter substrate-binding protein [Vitreimonas sp.]
MRTYYWYLSAYLRKHGFVMLASIVIAVILFSLLLPLVINRLSSKKRTYIGVVGEYSLTSLPLPIQQKLSAGLTQVLEDGSVAPDLSERWTVENDGKDFRFVLKKNITWQDGQPLTPADVTYNFKDVKIITTPNDIVFKLPDTYVAFPTVVSQPLLKTQTIKRMGFFTQENIIGLGAYRLVNYKLDGPQLKEVIVENDTERLVYRFYLTEEEAVLGFKRGEVDQISDLATSYGLESWPTVQVTKHINYNRYLGVFFNNNHPAFLKNVRQALSYATPKPADDIRAAGPISPQSWASFQGAKTYDYDLERATERLLSEPPQQPLNLELTTTTNFHKDAEEIKQHWEKLGQEAYTSCQNNKDIKDKAICENVKITVTVRINNYPDTSNFQILLVGQESPQDPDQYTLWHSEQSSNFIHYRNTRIDSLLEKGRKTFDQTERLAIYQEFQQFFLEDAPVVFIKHLESYEVKR